MTGQVNFNSHLDAIVSASVELVNRLTPGEARGRTFTAPEEPEAQAAAVVAALTAAGRRPRVPIDGTDGAEFAEFAARLREVFAAVARDDVNAAAVQVNWLLADTGARPQLDRHDGEPWHLHFHGRDESMAVGWAAGCATGLAVVLGSDGYGRLGVCTAPRCDRVYVDTSRNGTRRFCSTACQNRVKAAAFRARSATG
ncbi:MAG: CGNR zinc finger domain-containing protein [Mycobacteriales bacterium]